MQLHISYHIDHQLCLALQKKHNNTAYIIKNKSVNSEVCATEKEKDLYCLFKKSLEIVNNEAQRFVAKYKIVKLCFFSRFTANKKKITRHVMIIPRYVMIIPRCRHS